jgi:hypothetical protein
VLLTRSPLRHTSWLPSRHASLDLHALGAPPAFVLSQDQTLHRKFDLPDTIGSRLCNRLDSRRTRRPTESNIKGCRAEDGVLMDGTTHCFASLASPVTEVPGEPSACWLLTRCSVVKEPGSPRAAAHEGPHIIALTGAARQNSVGDPAGPSTERLPCKQTPSPNASSVRPDRGETPRRASARTAQGPAAPGTLAH